MAKQARPHCPKEMQYERMKEWNDAVVEHDSRHDIGKEYTKHKLNKR